MNQRGVSPCREEVWLLVAEGNRVAVRRGGEQPEANDSSATQVNSIRPVTLASLLVNGEAQVTIRPTGTGVPGPRRPVTRGEARTSITQTRQSGRSEVVGGGRIGRFET